MKLRDYIRRTCLSENITPEEIAAKWKISLSSLYAYMAEQQRPPLKKAIAISKLTGGKVSVAELRLEVEEPNEG